MTQSFIAITMGDPAGVGPELCARLLTARELHAGSIPLVFGDHAILERVCKATGIECDVPTIEWREWLDKSAIIDQPSIVQASAVDLQNLTPGVIDAFSGQASFDFVDNSVKAAINGDVDAVVTGPIHKEAWQQAGVTFPGHTEMLADRCQAPRSCMMLTSEEVTCSFVTAHVGLYEVPELITQERVLETIELTADAMSRLRGRPPRLVVCGLNPHAGEHGLFGKNEEEDAIVPAIKAAQSAGIDVVGPLPADTAFLPKQRWQTDAFVCMYHDQGLTVLKALAFDQAVNVTVGLPIVRTSVDHGTALDLAWEGTADSSSLFEAYRLAQQMIQVSSEMDVE